MEKCIIFLLAILCSNVNLFAQSEISGTVYNKNNECVCSVTITLYCESNSSSTYEVMTDEEGYFEFKNIEEGNYFLVASKDGYTCLLYTSPSPRDATLSRMPSSA